MKKILFFLLLSVSAFAQFPTKVVNPHYAISFAERQRAESFPLSIANFNAAKGTGVVGTTSYNVGYNNQMTFQGQRYNSANASSNQLLYVSTNGNRVVSMGSITVSVSTTVSTPATYTIATTTGVGGTTYTLVNNSTLTIPGYDLHAPDFFILYLATPNGGASNTEYVQFVVSINNGWDMTDDDRPGVQFVQMEIGDSITNGTGTVATVDTWLFALNQYYRNRGYLLRRVNRGEYGKKSDYIASRFNYGYYNFNADNIKVLTYMIGTNDGNIGTTLTTAQLDVIQANIQVALDWRYRFCPNSVMFLIGAPTPSTTYAQIETNLVLIRARQRTIVQNWITAHPTDTKIRFVDFGGTAGDASFPAAVLDKTNQGYYSDGLHPNKPGNALLGTSITNYIDLPANKNVLVPSFIYSLN